ncbi:MAG: hypothetical protein ABR564_08145 [Candidatus Dormibacteria bacterium]
MATNVVGQLDPAAVAFTLLIATLGGALGIFGAQRILRRGASEGSRSKDGRSSSFDKFELTALTLFVLVFALGGALLASGTYTPWFWLAAVVAAGLPNAAHWRKMRRP